MPCAKVVVSRRKEFCASLVQGACGDRGFEIPAEDWPCAATRVGVRGEDCHRIRMACSQGAPTIRMVDVIQTSIPDMHVCRKSTIVFDVLNLIMVSPSRI